MKIIFSFNQVSYLKVQSLPPFLKYKQNIKGINFFHMPQKVCALTFTVDKISVTLIDKYCKQIKMANLNEEDLRHIFQYLGPIDWVRASQGNIYFWTIQPALVQRSDGDHRIRGLITWHNCRKRKMLARVNVKVSK